MTCDADADWGCHETLGSDAWTGRARSKLRRWVGYGLHLIADTTYELPLAFEVTPACYSGSAVLRAIIMRGTFTESLPRAERCADFSADRGR